MSRRNVLLLLSIILIGTILVSCSSPEVTEAPVVAPGEEEVALPSPRDEFMAKYTEYTGPPLTEEKITLTILRTTRQDYEEAIYDGWNEEFMAAFPNITIQQELIPFGDLFQKIQVIIAGGEPPDVLLIDAPFVKSYCFFDILEPLNDYVTQEFIDDYAPPTAVELSCDGKMYAFPSGESAQAITFNRQLFADAGLETPPETEVLEDGWTWEQYADVWQKLTIRPSGDVPSVWGLGASYFGAGGVGSNYYLEGIWIRGMGDPNAPKDSDEYKTWAAISPDGKDVVGYLDSPLAIEGMQFYQNIFQEWQVSPTVGVPNQFVDEKAATQVNEDGFIGTVKNNNPDLDFGVSPIAHYETGVPFSHGGTTTFSVPNQAKHKAEGMMYLVFIHSQENRRLAAEATHHLPARMSVYAMIPFYSEYPDKMLMQTSLLAAAPRPPGPGYSQYQNVADRSIKDIGLGADVASTLHAAAIELQGYLDETFK
jgi:multiple sugar transport system substrate-binding protein